MLLKENATILFQGDSITDAGRSRENPDDLGRGYPYFVAAMLRMKYPALNLKFINRGISGNRTSDLMARWQEDCIDLQPDILSILIGINDCWRRFDSNMPMTDEEYCNNYKSLLQDAAAKTNARLIIIEPFLLPYPQDRIKWREDLDPKIQRVRALAREFGALYIPMDGLFTQAALKSKDSDWLGDGVHPTPQGHALIAENWIKVAESNS